MDTTSKIIMFPLVLLIGLSCSNSKSTSSGFLYNSSDTVEGFFLYEVNVPRKCFTRFDQIEQGNNFVHFDSVGLNTNLFHVYKKGVFYFSYQPVIADYILKMGISTEQDKISIHDFTLGIDYLNHRNDSNYNKTLYYDGSKLLTYKKFYAKFTVKNLGHIDQLIPKTMNYECCYWNQLKSVQTYLVKKIISFRIY